MDSSTLAAGSGHGSELALGWYVIVGLWALLILAAAAVFVDSMLPYRKRRVVRHAELVGFSREPLVFYTVATGLAIAIWVATAFSGNMPYEYALTVAAAFAAIIAVPIIFAYLLRMMFPRVPADKVEDYLAARGGQAGKKSVDRHEVSVIEVDDSDDNPKGA